MVQNYFKFLQIPLFFVLFFLLPLNISAQCAGNDVVAPSVCDVPNVSSKTINLFSFLTGSPTPGGTWSDDNSSGGLDTTTGILNAQLIRRSATYKYTYTVAGVTGCADNTATVTITIGAYAGVPSPNVSVCNANETFNLFQAFNGTFLSPQSNGVWHDDTNNAPAKSTIPVKDRLGTYQYTYSIPAIGGCSAKSSTVVVTLFKAPKPGKPIPLLLCGTDGLAGYHNLNLNDLLSGEDSGGIWSDPINSGELDSPTDQFVNLQNLFDTYGEREFSFTYTVFSDNSICTDQSETVVIRLEKKLDFTGAVVEVSSDICEPEIATAKYAVTLTQGNQAIPDGEYEVTFNVSGANGGSEVIKALFTSGKLTFPINSGYFQRVGAYTFTITRIVSTSSQGACTNIINNLFDILNVNPIPVLNGAKLVTTPVCQNKDADVLISQATLLADGDYTIIYNITGDNAAFAQTASIKVVGGNSKFTIPGNVNIKSGVSIITITNITNQLTKCTNVANTVGNLTINPLPTAATIQVAVNDFYCLSAPVSVNVSGLGTLQNVTISYSLSGSNPSVLQTVIVPVNSGVATFIIPAGLLVNTGSTIISFTNIVNNTTTCDINLTNVLDSFSINPIPAEPTANNQVFCKAEGATVANLSPNGPTYKWYISATATTPLAGTYVLKSEEYFVTVTSSAGCTSLPTKVTVTVNDSPAPTLTQGDAEFCGLDNPTILDLSNKTNIASSVVWYDAQNNGNLLSQTTKLVDKQTYFGFDFSMSTGCISDDYLAATVSLIVCDNAQYKFFVPDGFSPNGDNVNDTFRIPDIDFLYPDYNLEIFNRYGNIMFKGNKNKPEWDGKNSEGAGFGDGIAPNGVYFYVIHFNKGNEAPRQGRLYLNR